MSEDAENAPEHSNKPVMKERLSRWKEHKATARTVLHAKSSNSRPNLDQLSFPTVPQKIKPGEHVSEPKESNHAHNKAKIKSDSGPGAHLPKPTAPVHIDDTSQPRDVPTSEAQSLASVHGPHSLDAEEEELFKLLEAGPRLHNLEPTSFSKDHAHKTAIASTKLVDLQEKKIQELEKQLSVQKRTIESVTARASSERTELTSRNNANLEAFERTLHQAESKIKDLQTQLLEKTEAISSVCEARDAALQQIAQLHQSVEFKSRQITQLDNRLGNALEGRVPKLELDIAIEDRDKLAAEYSETKALLDECTMCLEEMEEKERRISQLKGEIASKNERIKLLEAQLLAAEDNNNAEYIRELETAVEDLISENEGLHVRGAIG